MPIGMREVAKAAGVSYATVSNVLSPRPGVNVTPGTRERVLRAAERLNYQYNMVAGDLRRGRSHAVAIQLRSLHVPILATKVATLEQRLREAGLYPFLCHTFDPVAEQQFYQECLGRRVGGVILATEPRPAARPYMARLVAEGILVVALEIIPDSSVPYVTVDRGAGATAAVNHLFSLGHRRVAMVNGFGGRGRARFREGYRRALVDRGIPFDPGLVFDLPGAPSLPDAGAAIVEQWLALPDPITAVLLPDDEVAQGALWALDQRGVRVPDDIALVGYDDLPASAYARVPLTTLAQPAEAVGSRLAELFLEGLNDPEQIAGRGIELPPRLIVRESCGASRRSSIPHAGKAARRV
jgi:DNA-binding LacI/PurR family transcriptional regulator